MKPPRFWFLKTPNWQARLLHPLALLWQSQTRKRIAQKGERAPCPVISIGNINLGGTGKTPTAIYLVQALQSAGLNPVVILRGFKGKAQTPQLVSNQSAEIVGDEALLLSQFAPTIIAKNRAQGAKLAKEHGNIIILDDALQNPALIKDISICVFDAEIGLGNGRICPSGPLRESLEDAMPRIDAALFIGTGSETLRQKLNTKPQFSAKLSPIDMEPIFKTGKFIAFAGIGRPEKFFNTLRALGANLVETHEFGDHENYSNEILDRMKREAESKRAKLITTEKDAMRLPPSWQGQILSLPVRLEMTDGDLAEWVLAQLEGV